MAGAASEGEGDTEDEEDEVATTMYSIDRISDSPRYIVRAALTLLLIHSSVVSAGLLRVFGSDIAELPLVATTKGNQGKGYLRLLFTCIEKLLAFLNVRSFVLPAAIEAESIWIEKFGFQKVPPEQLNNYRKRCWQMISFKGTAMLEKAVPLCEITCLDSAVFDLSADSQDEA